jgi:hypothetical protein
MNERMCKCVWTMVGTVVATGVWGTNAANTREKDKQEVKQDESGLIPCLIISCLKPIPKLALVLTDDPYIY